MKFKIDHDYHIHSKLSLCSDDALQNNENILKYAVDNNLRKICLTDHFWDESIDADGFEFYTTQNFKYISKALPLPQAENVEFCFGCETDMNKFMQVGISDKLMDKFDFIIVSTTHLHMMGFTLDEKDNSLENRAELYVKRIDKLLSMDLPFHKVGLAHLACSLMAPNNQGDYIKVLNMIEDKTFEELFSRAARLGMGIELNHPVSKLSNENLEHVLRPYRLAKKCGCRFYLGSDSHHPRGFEVIKSDFPLFIEALDLKESDKFGF